MTGSDKALAVGLLILAIVFGVQALQFPFGSLARVGPAFFPLLLAAILGIFSILLFVRAVRTPDAEPIEWAEKAALIRIGVVVCACVVYPFVLPALGFLPSTFILVSAMFLVSTGGRLPSSMLRAALTTVALTLVFQVWLGISFPRGIFGI